MTLKEKRINNKKYPIDSGGIIHMASLEDGYANTYRMTVAMKETIDEEKLKVAYNDVKDRFPTIVAGIRKGVFSYYIMPIEEDVDVYEDKGVLVPFSLNEIKECAIKVLYKENTVSIEVFHSLTDASGGAVFFRTLLARYVELKYGEKSVYSNQTLNYNEEVCEEEISDDYIKEVLLETLCKAKFETDKGKIVFSLDNKIVRSAIKSKLQSKGYFFDTSFNSELISLTPEALTVLINEIYSDNRAEELTELLNKKLPKDKAKDKLSITDVFGELLKGGAKKIGELGVASIFKYLASNSNDIENVVENLLTLFN